MKIKQINAGSLFAKKAVIATLVLISLIGIAGSVQSQEEVMGVEITISPSTLVLSDNGKWVTVHTDIAYGDFNVRRDSILLNDIPVAWTKSDNCGNLVAKFAQADIMGIVEVGKVTLELTSTLDGVDFSGEDTIRVITSGK